MSRPTLVIGLGGTGQWVLRYVKREMLEIHDGEMPGNVRLLCFDTEAPGVRGAGLPGQGTAKSSAGKGAFDSLGEAESKNLFGDVELQPHLEYFWLEGNVNQLIDDVINGQYKEIGEWFPAGYFKEILAPGERTLAAGAGAWRQFGRLAVFADLLKRSSSLIKSHIDRAAAEIQRADADISDMRPLEVVVVCSLVGGTGAGMAIDMANIVRDQLRVAQVLHFHVRGIFVLPRAFGAWDDQDADSKRKRARAFAAWQELDRFRLSGGVVRGIPMRYTEDMARVIDEPLFDNTYLVDGTRSGAGGALLQPQGKPEYHVFPTVADFVGMLIDDNSGPRYSAWAANLRSQQIKSHRPYYGAMGAFTIRSAARQMMREQTHSFGRRLLEQVCEGVTRPQTPAGDLSKQVALQVTEGRNNEQYPNFRGRDDKVVQDFMGSDQQRYAPRGAVPMVYANPPFVKEIAQVAFMDPQQAAGIAMAYRNAGDLVSRMEQNFVQIDGPQDLPPFQAQADIRDLDQVAPRTGVEGAASVDEWPAANVGPISVLIQSTYGAANTTELGDRGNYGRALLQIRDRQVERFARVLQTWLTRTLMGETDDAIQARSGKLGFAIDFMGEAGKGELMGLTHALEQYRRFLTEDIRRARAGLQDQALAGMQQWDAYMRDESQKKVFLGGLRKALGSRLPPEKAQDSYREAVRYYMAVLRDETLLIAREQAVHLMLETVKQVRGELVRWRDTLAGDKARGVEGLYDGLERHKNEASRGAIWDSNNLTEVQEVLRTKAMADARQGQLLTQAIARLNWQLEPVTVPVGRDQTWALQIGCNLASLVDDGQLFSLQPGLDTAQLRRNVQAITGFAGTAMKDMWQDERVASRLLSQYHDLSQYATEADGEAALVKVLLSKGQPLYSPQRARSVSRWMRVAQPEAGHAAFFEHVDQALRRQNVRAGQLTNSEDPYRFNMILTDELIESSELDEYRTNKVIYHNQAKEYGTQAGQLLHIFAADQVALDWALEIERETQDFQEFQPQTKACLGDTKRLALFFWSIVTGFIEYDEAGRRWVLNQPDVERDGRLVLKDDGRRWVDYQVTLTADNDAVASPRDGRNVMDAMLNFCLRGRDVARDAVQVRYTSLQQAVQAVMNERGQAEIAETVRSFLLDSGNWLDKWRDAIAKLQPQEQGGNAQGGPQEQRERVVDGIDDYRLYQDLVRIAALALLKSQAQYRIDLGWNDGRRRREMLKEAFDLQR